MTSGGWIKKWRKSRKNPYLREHDARGIFDLLLMDAMREDCTVRCKKVGRDIELKRGQLWVSVRDLVTKQTSLRRVRVILDELQDGELITVERRTGSGPNSESSFESSSGPSFESSSKRSSESSARPSSESSSGLPITIITICNYDRYQVPELEKVPLPNQVPNQVPDALQTPGPNQVLNQVPDQVSNHRKEKITQEDREIGFNPCAPARAPTAVAQAPPPTQPDPEKFEMTESWQLGLVDQERLTAQYVPKLSVDGFWRQVRRFRDHHRGSGTIDTQAGFTRSLANWLERANANRSEPVTETAAAANGHDPPRNPPLFQGIEITVFRNRVAALYDAALKDNSLDPLSNSEHRSLLQGACDLKIGRTMSVGIERGGFWDVDEVARRLGLAPELDQVAS